MHVCACGLCGVSVRPDMANYFGKVLLHVGVHEVFKLIRKFIVKSYYYAFSSLFFCPKSTQFD